MQFQASLTIKKIEPPISYHDKLLFMGSCFTEHISGYMQKLKFSVLENPNGIIFDPISVCRSLISYVRNEPVQESDVFQLNEMWHSWEHHSRFSHMHKHACIQQIQDHRQKAHEFLQQSDWLFITLGSAFAYKYLPDQIMVANCHKAPAGLFDKRLISIEKIISTLDNTIHRLFHFNPNLKIIFTVSPVRHLRDGLIDNNRSKARLIETVHHLVHKFEKLYYFPAYEIVIDELRDYRFYDIDLTHPNYAATQYVIERFTESCIDTKTVGIMEEIKKIITAKNHKPFNPSSTIHKQFLQAFFAKTIEFQKNYPHIDLSQEVQYFQQQSEV